MVFVKALQEVEDYKEAIRISCHILQENGVVEERYYKSILNNIEEYGGYFYLGKGICMPHARVEEGAVKAGICVLSLKYPVSFCGNEVRIFLTLSAGNEGEHFGNLQKIIQICSDDEKVRGIREAKNDEELSALIGG